MNHHINRPLFIIGTGRSGTTMLFDLLYVHKDLAWPSQHMLGNHYDKYDKWQRRMSRVPFIDAYAKRKKRHRSFHEPYELWRRFDPGFNRPCRDLRAEDVTDAVKTGMRKAVVDQRVDMGKDRFITKYTGWSRIHYIDTIFPDAMYLNVIRDGRAVAASLLTREWWHGWHGPNQWRWGVLSEENEIIWRSSNQSFFVLAGLQWKILMENICETGTEIGQRYKEIRYEDIMVNPEKAFSEILHWSGLPQYDDFLAHINKANYKDANDKYKTEIHPDEINRFERLLGTSLNRFGYEV